MNPKDLLLFLEREDLKFITGVPCSHFGGLLTQLNSENNNVFHVRSASEGEAVGIAAGYHLATNKTPIIYLQNSGLGNTINPLTSLIDKLVYSIPAIFFISWRGEPGIPDEPQHKKMGMVMIKLLKDLDLPCGFANNDLRKTITKIKKLKKIAEKEQKPVALIFKAGLFEKTICNESTFDEANYLLTREQILEILLPKLGKNPVVTTTGKTSREVFELREKLNQSHKYDFLTVGSMGCALGIGFGISLQSDKKVFVIDGDGAVLMRMGTLATVGYYKPKNMVHIIIDNQAYESTGGQPSSSSTLNWELLLKGAGYPNVIIVKTKQELENLVINDINEMCAIVIYSRTGSRQNLGRPTSTPIENKIEFMKFINTNQN